MCMFTNLSGIEAIEFGRCNENNAIAKFEVTTKLVVQDCGFIYRRKTRLSRWFDAIIEVKLAFGAASKNFTLHQVTIKRKITFWKTEVNDPKPKKCKRITVKKIVKN